MRRPAFMLLSSILLAACKSEGGEPETDPDQPERPAPVVTLTPPTEDAAVPVAAHASSAEGVRRAGLTPPGAPLARWRCATPTRT